MDERARRAAQAMFLVLSILLIVLAGGVELATRPVGLAFLIVWTALALSTAALRLPGTPSRYDRSQIVQRTVLGVGGFLVLLVVGPWEYTHLDGPLPRDGILAWAGIGLFASGTFLYGWAMWALHGEFTIRLSVQGDHRLVTSGPYRIVRHPGYFGFVLAMPGMAFALGSVAMLAFGAVIVAWIVSRIRVEEAMLLEQFGDEYRDYQRRTKRLIPFVY